MNLSHFAYSSAPNLDHGLLIASTYTPLTLQGGEISIELRGNCARVCVQYEYINQSGKAERVIAAYPLPPTWGLMSCRADIPGESIWATHEDYYSDYSTPVGSTVASQKLPWVIGVGASVRLTAIYELPLDITRRSGIVQVRVPAELFLNANPPPSTTQAYEAFFNIRQPQQLSEEWTINVKGDLFVPLIDQVRINPTNIKGATANVDYIGDSGFILHYTAPLSSRLREGFSIECRVRDTVEPLRFFLAKDYGTVVQNEDRYALTLAFTPQLEGRRGCCVNMELIILIDSHNRYTSTAFAHGIRIAVPGVPESVRVNVVIVGDKEDISLCPKGSLPLAELPFDQITAFIADAEPQKGLTGTSKLNRALRAVMKNDRVSLCGPVPTGYVRHVIVLTDEGDSQHATDIIEDASHHKKNMCFSAIGLLSSGTADIPMLELLSEEGGGVYRNAKDASQIPGALVDILTRIAVPTLTDIVIHFDEEKEIRTSIGTTIPAIPQGTQRFIYGLAPDSLTTLGVSATGRVGSTVIEYVGKGNVEEVIFTASAEFRNALSIGLFHLAVASARIRYLVDTREVSTLSEVETQEVIRLSKTFQIPSPLTQMIQSRPGNNNNNNNNNKNVASTVIAIRYVPRHQTFIRQMIKRRRELIANGTIDRTPIQHQQEQMQEKKLKEQIQASGAIWASQPPNLHPTIMTPPTSREFIRNIVNNVVESIISAPNIDRLTTLQSIDGSFPLNAMLSVCIGVPLERLEKEVPLAGFGVSEDMTAAKEYLKSHERVWATAAAAAAMELSSVKITALVYKKALMYVSSHDTEGELLQRARGLFQKSPLV